MILLKEPRTALFLSPKFADFSTLMKFPSLPKMLPEPLVWHSGSASAFQSNDLSSNLGRTENFKIICNRIDSPWHLDGLECTSMSKIIISELALVLNAWPHHGTYTHCTHALKGTIGSVITGGNDSSSIQSGHNCR